VDVERSDVSSAVSHHWLCEFTALGQYTLSLSFMLSQSVLADSLTS